MATMTYRQIIRTYAQTVADGYSDADLTARERQTVRVMLNLASNSGYAAVLYPPTDQTRIDVKRSLSDILWNARALMDAVAPRSANEIGNAIERAYTILDNV